MDSDAFMMFRPLPQKPERTKGMELMMQEVSVRTLSLNYLLLKKYFLQVWFVGIISFLSVILLVGFAYEWRMGALDWVKSIRAQDEVASRVSRPRSTSSRASQESILSA